MKHLLSIALLIMSITALLADEPDTLLFHVIAESGLVLRSDKGIHSENLAVIPYEDTLRVVGIYLMTSERDKVTIDGKEGHWLPAIYQGQEGFIFTAYVRRGHKYIPDNPELLYRFMFEKMTQIPLNYAPDLYWYGFYVDSSDMSVYMEEIELSMQLAKEQYDYEDPYNDRQYYMPITDNSKKAKFIIGMKKPMESLHRKTWMFQGKQGYDDGKFLHAYETMQLHGSKSMYLKPIVELVKDTNYQGKVTELMAYQLTLTNLPYAGDWQEKKDMPFPNILHETRSADMHTIYKNPQVFWKGDLNEDGNEDLIMRTSHMSDSCGGSIDFHILISHQKGEYFFLEKLGWGSLFHEGC